MASHRTLLAALLGCILLAGCNGSNSTQDTADTSGTFIACEGTLVDGNCVVTPPVVTRCDTGTLVNGECVVNPTVTVKECPAGSILVDSQCVVTPNVVTKECETGTLMDGKCVVTPDVVTETCAVGTLVDGKCVVTPDVVTGTCAIGTLVDGKCVVTPTVTVKACPADSVLDGNQCVITPNVVTKACDTGTLVGNQCVVTPTVTIKECPADSVLDGGNCVPVVPPVDPIVKVTCTSNIPDGWESSNKAKYQVSAVDSQIIRVQIGATILPEDASWAVSEKARTKLACETATESSPDQPLVLQTPDIKVSLDRSKGTLLVTDSAGHVLMQDAQPPVFRTGNGFVLRQAIPAGSAFFGLGDKPDSIDKSNKRYTLWNTDRYGADTDPLYKSIPFFIRASGGTYTGFFLDNTWRTNFDFGKTQPGVIAMDAAGGGVDYYVISGKSPKEVVANYAKLTGVAPLPPLWSFGFQQSRYSYVSATEATRIADTLRKNKIPADAIWLDIGFQDKNYPFTVGEDYRPLHTLVKDMDGKGFHTIVIADLHIAQQSNGTYPLYTSGRNLDYFVKQSNGYTDYAGKVWPTDVDSVFPDFTREKVRQWWGTLLEQFYVFDGVSGFWNDMNEPSVFNVPGGTMPEDNVHKIAGSGFTTRTATHAEVHNVFGSEQARSTYEGALELKPDQRPYVMTRAGYAGTQRYGVTWTGDNRSTWEHLGIATNTLSGLGLSGLAYAAVDIGGYAGNPSSQLLTRWLQIGMFYPISRDHTESGSDQQEPWEKVGWEPNIEDLVIRTRYIRERYALMPYIYSIAEETSRTGIPMMRRMFLEFPNATAPGDTSGKAMDLSAETQFMFGPNLLVAPSPVELGTSNLPFGMQMEAEIVTLSGGAKYTKDHTGYTGPGFVDGFYPNPGATITTTLKDVPEDGQYALQVRYANGAGSARTVSVSVDGNRVGPLTLPSLANWDTWDNVSFPLQLNAGDHTLAISYRDGDSGNVNFDSFAVTNVGATFPAVFRSSTHTQPYDALMPPGKWYDYWTGKVLPDPEEGTSAAWKYTIASPSLNDLPVFVRGGSIIPRLPKEKVEDIKSTRDVQKLDQLELAIYPGDGCAGTVYMNAGDGFGYQKGEYYRRSFTCTKTADQITVSFGAVEGTFVPKWTTVRLHIHGLADRQTVNDIKGLDAKDLVLEQGTIYLTLPEPKAAGTLTMSLTTGN